MTSEAYGRAVRMFTTMVTTPNPSVADKRAGYDQMLASLPILEGTEIAPVTFGGVPCLAVVAPGASTSGSVVMLHGGGYVMGSAQGYRSFASAVSRATGLAVVVVDYRLAPEHPYPAGLDDATTVYDALVSSERGDAGMVVLGDSGGGGLALGLLLRLRDEGHQLPACGVVISPEVDLTATSDSLERNRDKDPVVRRESILLHGGMYLNGRDPRATPYASPLWGDLDGLPPVLVMTGDAEAMHDEAVAIHDKMVASGTDATLAVYPGMLHVWPLFWSFLAEGQQAVDEIGAYVRSSISAG